MSDLRLLESTDPQGEPFIAAGVPWFTTLFGRDSLITSLQTLPFLPRLAIETLAILARRQATAEDPWRDAEPGKILHEFRTGEMSRTGELPFSPYYGSVDATPLWLILLGETYDWTGDDALVERYWPNALAALDWIDKWGDRDGDGFVEYERRAETGLRNQGWKDSTDAIRWLDGSLAETPIALAEVQGYVFDAKRRMARLARHRGDASLADRLDAEALELQRRFAEAFRLPDGSIAMALDRSKRPVDTIGSNAGHCLWTGIVPVDQAPAVAAALGTPAMDSGWGLRTYAADQPGYNPIGYHIGTVWPHDTVIAAAGLRRYGFDAAAGTLSGGLLSAAQHFPAFRLPELFCGFDRAATGAPIAYPGRLLAAGLGGGRLADGRLDDPRAAGRRGLEAPDARPAEPAVRSDQGRRPRDPGRRGVVRPAAPPLAWAHERRGAPQGRTARGGRPALNRRSCAPRLGPGRTRRRGPASDRGPSRRRSRRAPRRARRGRPRSRAAELARPQVGRQPVPQLAPPRDRHVHRVHAQQRDAAQDEREDRRLERRPRRRCPTTRPRPRS